MPLSTSGRSFRVLFLVRGKLGDTIAAWPTIRAYVDRHPEEQIVFAVRRNYSVLFADEPGIKLLPFASTAELYARILALRLTGRIDRLAVIWGFSNSLRRLPKIAGTKMAAYIDGRFGTNYPLVAEALPNDHISDPMWRVARLFDADLPRPQALVIGSLASRRTAARQNMVAIVPVADEPRRLFDRETLFDLISAARTRFPDTPIRLLGNPNDLALQNLLVDLPPDVELRPFPLLVDLVDALSVCTHLLTTDTGVYHLAAAMGVPTSIFLGPTQPHKTVLPSQHTSKIVRIAELGNRHCEVKDCNRPVCLYQAVAEWSGRKRHEPVEALPKDCLLLGDETQ